MRAGHFGWRAVLPAASCAAVLCACVFDASPESSTERTTDGVVERVSVRGPDITLDWQFHEESVIPTDAGGEIRLEGLASWEVGADREGRIYVLDRPERRVVVFGLSGRVVGSVGRPAGGRDGPAIPGELAEPVALAVADDGAVGVYDNAARGIVLWGASGEAPVLERIEPVFWGPGLGLADWGSVFPALTSDDREGRVVALVVVAETRTGVLAETTLTTVTAAFPGCGLESVPVEPLFEPRLEWALGGDLVAAVTGSSYDISVFRKGVPERQISRDITPRPATRDLALREAGDGIRLTAPIRCRVSPEEIVAARGFAATVPVISGLAVAPDGSIWVRRRRVSGEGESPIDVFGADGSYLGTLGSGSPFPVAFAGRASDYRVVSLRSTASGADEIVVHRIAR